MKKLHALIIAFSTFLALNDAGACSFARGYRIAKPIAPWMKHAGQIPSAPNIEVLSIKRGSNSGNFGSCSDAGIITFLLPNGKPKEIAYYHFRVISGEFPDLVLPDANILPVEIGDNQVGFRFVWLDLPHGQNRLEPFAVKIEVKAVSFNGAESRVTILKVSDKGGKPANQSLQLTAAKPAAAELGRWAE